MIGTHELLLIVRAQNQASAALGRVGRDVRRLQAQRDLGRRQAQVDNRMLQTRMRLDSIIQKNGSRNIAMQQRRLAIEHQMQNVQERTAGLAQRRAAITVRQNNLLMQEEKLQSRILGLEGKRALAASRESAARATAMSTYSKMQSLRIGGVGFQQAHLTAYRAVTAQRQADLNKMRADRALASARAKQMPAAIIKERQLASSIATRRVEETARAYRIAQAGVAGLTTELARLTEVHKGQIASLNATKEATIALDREEKMLRQTLINLGANWAHLNERELALIRTEGIHEKQLEDLRLRLLGVIAAQREEGIAAAVLGNNLKMLATDAEEIATERQLQRMERMRTIFSGMSHMGRVGQMFGAVGVLATGMAAHTAAQFQTQATLAATQARQPGAGIASTLAISGRIQKTVLDQMKEFPAASEEMNQSLFEIFSSTNVTSMKQAGDMLRVFNTMAVAGGTDLKTMTDAGISLYNNFGGLHGEFKNMTQAGNAFFAAVRYGRMNAEQFAGSLSSVLPIAKEAGLSFQDVAGAMAQLTRQSGARFTSRDATGLARMIQFLARPEAMKGLHKFGVEAETTGGKLQHLPKLMGDIAKMMQRRGIRPGPDTLNFFKQLTKAGGASTGFSGTIQAQRVFAYLIQNIEKYERTQKQVRKDTTEMNKAFGAMSKTPGVRWAIFTNVLRNFVIQVGMGVIPVVEKLGHAIRPVVKWFDGLSTNTKHAIGYFAAFSAIATLVGGTLLTIVGSLGVMLLGLRTAGKAFGIFGGTAKVATGEVVTLGSEAGAITASLALGLGALVAIPILIRYHHQVGQVVKAFGGLKNTLTLLSGLLLAITFTRQIRNFYMLVTAARAARTSILLTRAALLGMAGLVVTATLIVLERHKIVRSIKKALAGSGVPALDTTMDPQYGKAKYNKGAVGWLEANLGDTATKGPGGFLNRYFKQGPYTEALKQADINRRATDTLINKYAGTLKKWKKLQQDLFGGFQLPKLPTDPKAPKKPQAGTTPPVMKPGRSLDQWFTLIRAARKQMELHPHDFESQLKYEKLMEALAKAYKGAQLAAIQDVLSADETTTKKRAKNAKKLAEEQKQLADSMVQGIQGIYDNFLQQNQSAMGDLFSGPFIKSATVQNRLDWGGLLNLGDLQKDLKQSTLKFEHWRGDLGKVAKKVPPSLVQAIEAMGPEAAQSQLELLNKATPKQLATYVKWWNRSQKDIKTAALKDTQNQIKQWEKFGRNVASAIIRGVRSQDVAMENTLRTMLGQMFPGIKIGKTTPPPKPPSKGKKDVSNTQTYNYYIHMHGLENTDSAIAHALFRARNKHRK